MTIDRVRLARITEALRQGDGAAMSELRREAVRDAFRVPMSAVGTPGLLYRDAFADPAATHVHDESERGVCAQCGKRLRGEAP